MPKSVKSQSIYKPWYCEARKNLCVKFNEKTYSTVNELEFIKIKIKGKKLKLIDYYNTKAIFGGKDIYLFNIEKLTEDSLILTQNSKKNLYEQMPGDTIKFIHTPKGCSRKWEK